MPRERSREEAVFSEAITQPPASRSAFVAAACVDDEPLRVRILALLAAHAQPESLLPLATPVYQEHAGQMIGHYKLLEPIGEGGTGVVWLAEQAEPVRRRVALKILKLGMDTKTVVLRFQAEQQALARMDHPNIAQVFDAGATNTGRPFFAMEFVPGAPITRYCDEHRLTIAARLPLFTRVCRAVQHAHDRGIVHRDLKPSNILITSGIHGPIPKIIDFGIAKAMQGRLVDGTLYTSVHDFVGTPDYMSPEQLQVSAGVVDARADIYALGALLYELLVGRPPLSVHALLRTGIDAVRQYLRDHDLLRPSLRFGGLSPEDQLAVGHARATEPRRLAAEMVGDLDAIAMHCLEQDAARRYPSAEAIARDIDRHLQHVPVQARPATLLYHTGRFCRRHWAGLAAAAVCAVALWVGFLLPRRDQGRPEAAQARANAAPAPTGGSTTSPSAAALAQRTIAMTTDVPFNREDLGVAEALARKATELEPEAALSWGARALVEAWYVIRNWDAVARHRQDAQSYATRARSLEPMQPQAMWASAVVLMSQNSLPPAEKLLREAVAAHPKIVLLQRTLGLCLGLQNREPEQIAILHAARLLEPGNILVAYDLGLAYEHKFIHSGRTPSDYDLTVRYYSEAVRQRPFTSALTMKARFVVCWRGDVVTMRAALDELERLPLADRTDDRSVFCAMWGGLLENNPARTFAAASLTARNFLEDTVIAEPKAFMLAIAEHLEGRESSARLRWAEAEEVMRFYHSRSPQSMYYQAELAIALAWLDRTAEAEALIRGVVAVNAEQPVLNLARNLARYYAALGDAPNAVRYMRQCVDQTPYVTTYTLQLDPWWYRLRGRREFDAFVAELAAAAPRTHERK